MKNQSNSLYSIETLQEEKQRLLKQIGKKKEKMRALTQNLFTPPPITTKFEAIANGIESCMAVYDGIRFGKHAIQLFRNKFSRKKAT
ncbi:MAG: hypothetical protein RR386_02125 [Bacteroidaceae bacterium]